MYELVLRGHSLLRWAIVVFGLIAVVRALLGWSGRRPWLRADDNTGLLLTIAVDLQLVFGLLLYFVYSPYTALAMDDFGNAMRTSDLRFWAVEHVFGAVVGLVLIHVGRVRIRKTSDAAKKHRIAAIMFGIAMIAILVSIPWPGTPHARPLFPR